MLRCPPSIQDLMHGAHCPTFLLRTAEGILLFNFFSVSYSARVIVIISFAYMHLFSSYLVYKKLMPCLEVLELREGGRWYHFFLFGYSSGGWGERTLFSCLRAKIRGRLFALFNMKKKTSLPANPEIQGVRMGTTHPPP